MPKSVALITGSTAGIGRAIAFTLGRAGWTIAVTARTADDVASTVSALREAGIRADGTPADVSEPHDVTQLLQYVEGALGSVTTLVNNAGVGIVRPFEQLTVEDWDRTMAVNLRSIFLMTQAVLPAMRRAGSGDIVNIASLAGRNGFKGGTAYSASKHAVLGFGRSLMLEVRSEGIRVATVCPGSVDTEMLSSAEMIAPKPGAAILQSEDVAATVLSLLHLPRRAMVSELDIRPSNP